MTWVDLRERLQDKMCYLRHCRLRDVLPFERGACGVPKVERVVLKAYKKEESNTIEKDKKI